MKKITLMSLVAGVLFFTSACDSGQRATETTDNDIAEEQKDGALDKENEILGTENEATTSENDMAMEEDDALATQSEAGERGNTRLGAETDAAMSDSEMAHGEMPDSEMAAPSMNMTAPEFAKEAASAGMMEVELGRIASQKAENQQVKDFGQMMVDDHSKANDKLKSIVANKKDITLPTTMMDKHKQHVNHLSKLSGKEFDQAYMSMMVKDHKEDVNKFQAASKNLNDAEIKSFAANTLPVLQLHLAKAQQIHGSIGEGTVKDASSNKGSSK